MNEYIYFTPLLIIPVLLISYIVKQGSRPKVKLSGVITEKVWTNTGPNGYHQKVPFVVVKIQVEGSDASSYPDAISARLPMKLWEKVKEGSKVKLSLDRFVSPDGTNNDLIHIESVEG